MRVLRTTLFHPIEGREDEVRAVLGQLGEHVAAQPVFIDGYEVECDHEECDHSIGRVTVWATKGDADHAANQEHAIALWAKLHHWAQSAHQEHLLEVVGERHGPAAAAGRRGTRTRQAPSAPRA